MCPHVSTVSFNQMTLWPSDRDRAAFDLMKMGRASWRHMAIGELFDRSHLKCKSRKCCDFDRVDSGPHNRPCDIIQRYNPTAMQPPRHLYIRTVWEHSPTRKKRMEMMTINYRWAVRICVTAPIYLPGPTNPWALHLPTPCHVAPHTGV